MRFPDDLLKAIGHDDDIHRDMIDAEIITTALVAAMFFNGKKFRSKKPKYRGTEQRVEAPIFHITNKLFSFN